MQHLEARCPLDKLAPAGGMWPPSVQPSLLKVARGVEGGNQQALLVQHTGCLTTCSS
jgi:hypothetical protein